MNPADDADPRTLSVLLAEHPFAADHPLVTSESGMLTLGDVRARVDALAETLRAAGLAAGQAVGNLVLPGPSSLIVMFATWAAGGVYVPVNARYTADEVTSLAAETRLALLVGTPADLDAHPVDAGLVSYQHALAAAAVLRPAIAGAAGYPPDVAVISRTLATVSRRLVVRLPRGPSSVRLVRSLSILARAAVRAMAATAREIGGKHIATTPRRERVGLCTPARRDRPARGLD